MAAATTGIEEGNPSDEEEDTFDEADDGDLGISVEDYLIQPDELDIVDQIGEGSTAVVYKGLLKGDPDKQRPPTVVAVKEMVELHEESLTAFQRELCVLVKVEHPHIIKFIGLVSESDPLRLCLEYCEGDSLFNLLYNRSTKLSWRQRLVMLFDTATAVAHLHGFSPKIIHRDLKSLNVLLAEPITDEYCEPCLKLCDFGFTREVGSAGKSKDSMTQGAGTSHWMAPEVISGTKYTEKADTFSFAMIIYEVVCRRIPFAGVKPMNVPRLIMEGQRPGNMVQNRKYLESGKEVEVPPGLMELCDRCWQHDYRKRPTFPEIYGDLHKVSLNANKDLKKETPGELFDSPPEK